MNTHDLKRFNKILQRLMDKSKNANPTIFNFCKESVKLNNRRIAWNNRRKKVVNG